MPIKKKDKKVATVGFLDAAKIAAEIGDSKKAKKPVKKKSVLKKSFSKKTVATKVVVTSKKNESEVSNFSQSKTIVDSANVVNARQTIVSNAIDGFNDLEVLDSEKHAAIRQADSQYGRGIIEMVGGLTMVLILVEVVVIVAILVFVVLLR